MATDLKTLQQFKTIVLEDGALQDELRRCLDRPAFISLVLARASEHGCAITEAAVQGALNAGFQNWIMRGLDR